MSRRDVTLTVDLAMRTWAPKVNAAATGFEARWTRLAVRRLNPKWADALDGVLDDYARAMTIGTASEIAETGARLCRAYGAMAAELQAARAPDDAYMIGRDPASRLEIIIAATPAAAEYARKTASRFGKAFSPDEIATIIALDARAQKIAAVKAVFPGAEIVGMKGGDDEDADQA